MGHVGIIEMSANEPLQKYRKRRNDVKTRGVSLTWDKYERNLLTAHMASVMKVA